MLALNGFGEGTEIALGAKCSDMGRKLREFEWSKSSCSARAAVASGAAVATGGGALGATVASGGGASGATGASGGVFYYGCAPRFYVPLESHLSGGHVFPYEKLEVYWVAVEFERV